MDAIVKLKKEFDNVRKTYEEKFRAEGKKSIMEAARELFKQDPMLFAITWDQYTPYFNDGSPCEFTVYGVKFLHRSASADPVENDGYNYEVPGEGPGYEVDIGWEKPAGDHPDRLKWEFTRHIGSLGDILEPIFGDHARVFITEKSLAKNEVIVEECEHD